MRLATALSRYLLQLEANGRSVHTIAQARRHVTEMIQYLGRNRNVTDVSPQHLARFLTLQKTAQRPDGSLKKQTSMNAMRSSIRSFWRFGLDAGFVTNDPSRLVRDAVCAPPPPRALSQDEQTRLLATLANDESHEAERDRLLFMLLLTTGIRLGSAVALDVADVDLDAGMLELRTTKRNRPDRMAIPELLQMEFRSFIAFREHGSLFAITARHAQRRFQYWLSKSHIHSKLSPHSLRHSFATNLYQATGDLLMVRDALRHRSVSSTEIYSKTDDARVRLAVEAVANQITSNKNPVSMDALVDA